jgi:two-component system, LytTR family, response regulator
LLRTLLIDDEVHIRDTLRILLSRHFPEVVIVGEASGVSEGEKLIKELQPDLLILDIHLEDGTGFDLLHSIDKIDFKVIFISSMDRGLIQAFKLSSMEFLLKPINPVDLVTTMMKVSSMDPGNLHLQLKALDANLKSYHTKYQAFKP